MKKIIKNKKIALLKGDGLKGQRVLDGFSFIELIVVVTIIAVLSTIAMVSFSSVNKRSRDSRRISDLEKMRIALEMARQIGKTYPADAVDLVTNSYIQTALPKDPKTGSTYPYVQLNSGYRYTINATLEDPTSSDQGTTAYQVTNP